MIQITLQSTSWPVETIYGSGAKSSLSIEIDRQYHNEAVRRAKVQSAEIS